MDLHFVQGVSQRGLSLVREHHSHAVRAIQLVHGQSWQLSQDTLADEQGQSWIAFACSHVLVREPVRVAGVGCAAAVEFRQ
jgi:hypothetical protein